MVARLSLLLLVAVCSTQGLSLNTLPSHDPKSELRYVDDEHIIFKQNDSYVMMNVKTMEKRVLGEPKSTAKSKRPPQKQPDLIDVSNVEHYEAYIYLVPNPSRNPQLNKRRGFITTGAGSLVKHVGVMGEEGEEFGFFQWGHQRDSYIFQQNGLLYHDVVDKNGTRDQLLLISPMDRTRRHGVFNFGNEEAQAVLFSPDDDLVAFVSSTGPTGPQYVLTGFDKSQQYPIFTRQVYPKPGDLMNYEYWFYMWSTKERGAPRQLDYSIDRTIYEMLYDVSWIRLHGRQRLLVTWTNRYQNRTLITICSWESAACKELHHVTYPPRTWSNPFEYSNPPYSEDAFFYVCPVPYRDGNIYQHLCKIVVNDRDEMVGAETPLNIGAFDVDINVVENYPRMVNPKTGLVYFMAHQPDRKHYHLYATRTSPISSIDDCRCVSCSLGAKCTYQKVTISPQFTSVTVECLGPEPGKLKYTAHFSPDGYTLIPNHEPFSITPVGDLTKIGRPIVTYEDVKLKNGFVAHVQITKSPKVNERRKGAYPVLLYIYSGPESQGIQSASEQFFFGNNQHFVMAERPVILVNIDVRGHGTHGWKYKSEIHGRFGTVEIQDQIEALSSVLHRHDYMDARRVGVFGWSYGGFATLRLVETAPAHFFKCAASGAPVTNFYYYDLFYSSKYVGASDRDDFEITDATLKNLHKFNTTRLMLLHGYADDNVHFHNMAIMLEELQVAGVDFDFVMYPNGDHHMGTRAFYDQSFGYVRRFLEKCFFR